MKGDRARLLELCGRVEFCDNADAIELAELVKNFLEYQGSERVAALNDARAAVRSRFLKSGDDDDDLINDGIARASDAIRYLIDEASNVGREPLRFTQ